MSHLQSAVTHSFMFGVNRVDVVSQSEDGDTFFDLFDAQSGQCINEGTPLWEEPLANGAELEGSVKKMLADFYA